MILANNISGLMLSKTPNMELNRAAKSNDLFWFRRMLAERYLPMIKKIGLSILLLMVGSPLHASGPHIYWDGWNIDIHSVGCDLKNAYAVPIRAKEKGQLSGTPFYELSFRFSTPTKTRGNLITKKSIGVISASVRLARNTTQSFPKGVIVGLRINEMEAFEYSNSFSRIDYRLNEKQSLKLFEEFKDGERIEFEFVLSSNKNKIVTIYPGLKKYNYVWTKLFETCIKENKLY